MEIKFTISEDKVQRVTNAMKGLYPIPQIPDPEWKDPKDGSQAPMIPEFTNGQWAREVVRRFIIQQVARWEQVEAQRNIKFQPDNTIVK